MSISFYKKFITSSLIILTLAIGSFSLPQKAHATMPVAEVGGSLFQQIMTQISAAGTAISTYSLELKAFVLDTAATSMAKLMIRQITADVVNWINSGFQGSPAFVTNPGAFFLDVADQLTGEFLDKYGGPLTALCSPFSIDLRLALAFKYHPKIQKKYACTLGTIIANSQNAVNNATINGQSINRFMDGDFSQGGWPAFVSMTTEPQNNPYGAYLEANSEIGLRVANAQIQQREELNQGKGFLSWKTCARYENAPHKAQGTIQSTDTETGEITYQDAVGTISGDTEAGVGTDGTVKENNGKGKCVQYETQTPGSLIAGSLENSSNGPLRELELVDSINQIVNALAAQLITTVLHGGLRSVTGTGPSDSSSYVNQIQYEAADLLKGDLQNMRNEFIASVGKYINDTGQMKYYKDESLRLMSDIGKEYDKVRACYTAKINNAQPPLNRAQIADVEARVQTLNQMYDSEVKPTADRALQESTSINTTYNNLIKMRDDSLKANTVNELSPLLTTFSQMVRGRNMVTSSDIVNAQRAHEDLRSTASSMKQKATQELHACQIYTPTGSATYVDPNAGVNSSLFQ